MPEPDSVDPESCNHSDASEVNQIAESAWPYLTSDLARIGGTIKQEPEDFIVEEIPAYEPCGEGEHLFLWIEKRDVSAEHLTRRLRSVLGVSDRDLGVAGMKDRRAITRQYVSVPAKLAEKVTGLESDDIHVVKAVRHTNKLRTGHLRGNSFTILVRNVPPDAIDSARPIAQRISASGFPNYYGAQRFGHDGETLRIGFDLISGRKTVRDLPRSRARFLLKLAVSAVQSHLFNLALAARIEDGSASRVSEGDVMQVVASGGIFVAENVEVEQARCDAGEITVTGPMFGPKMSRPRGEPLEQEMRLLDSCGLSIDDFARFVKLAQGTRRSYMIRPSELAVEQTPDGLKFQFVLPSGVYATTLLREFQKDQ